MTKKLDTIDLFMWGYQRHFRVRIRHQMEEALRTLGLRDPTVECLLIGVRDPRRGNQHDVCVEPEDEKWEITRFADLFSRVETAIGDHPGWQIKYTDDQSTRDQPERIRRDTVRQEAQTLLDNYGSGSGVHSFCGDASLVCDHYVVPIFQFQSELFDRFPPLRKLSGQSSYTPPRSLIHATIREVLNQARMELERNAPGSRIGETVSSREIVRNAAASFLHAPGKAIDGGHFLWTNLFDQLNAISSWMYEGEKSSGRFLLASRSCDEIDVSARFANTVPFSEPRWARKVLAMAPSGMPLVADTQGVYGLGKLSDEADPWSSQEVFEIDFVGHYHWRLLCGDKVLLVSRYGIPSLSVPEPAIDHLTGTHARLFPESKPHAENRLAKLYDAAVTQGYGSMLIVAKDAASEAMRLERQGCRIEPIKLTSRLYRQVSRIDGAVLVDPDLICYAIGVILDGPAHVKCTPSRGSRYNSGLRYVLGSDVRRLAVVVSDDKTVDVIPEFRPCIGRSAVEKAVAELEIATKDNYQTPLNWLGKHRFYMSGEQCRRVNRASERIEREVLEGGAIWWDYGKFEPDSELDDSYFEASRVS